jgi:hypothetical protein
VQPQGSKILEHIIQVLLYFTSQRPRILGLQRARQGWEKSAKDRQAATYGIKVRRLVDFADHLALRCIWQEVPATVVFMVMYGVTCPGFGALKSLKNLSCNLVTVLRGLGKQFCLSNPHLYLSFKTFKKRWVYRSKGQSQFCKNLCNSIVK